MFCSQHESRNSVEGFTPFFFSVAIKSQTLLTKARLSRPLSFLRGDTKIEIKGSLAQLERARLLCLLSQRRPGKLLTNGKIARLKSSADSALVFFQKEDKTGIWAEIRIGIIKNQPHQRFQKSYLIEKKPRIQNEFCTQEILLLL